MYPNSNIWLIGERFLQALRNVTLTRLAQAILSAVH